MKSKFGPIIGRIMSHTYMYCVGVYSSGSDGKTLDDDEGTRLTAPDRCSRQNGRK